MESTMIRNKRFYYIIYIFVFLLLGCGEKIDPGNVEPSNKGSVKAPVVSAKIISQPLLYESVGTVNAKVVSTISSKLMGSVRKIFVREGDHVNKGDQLAVIDDRQVLATLREAKAALEQARRAEAAASASAELASVTYARYQNRSLMRSNPDTNRRKLSWPLQNSASNRLKPVYHRRLSLQKMLSYWPPITDQSGKK